MQLFSNNRTGSSTSSTPLLVDAVLPQQGVLREVIVLLVGSWIVAACAQIEIPLWPVPVTGQTFGVLIVGGMLGRKRGAAAIVGYLLQGSIGLPFFAGGASGFHHLLGPTGGYLIGFVAAAWVIGLLFERGWGQSFSMASLGMGIATCVILAAGLGWLSAFVPTHQLLQAGLIPFLPGAVIKIVAAAGVIRLKS